MLAALGINGRRAEYTLPPGEVNYADIPQIVNGNHVLTFRSLTAAMGAAPLPGQAPRWWDVMLELLPAISSPLTSQAERLLLGIVRFEGRLRLNVSSDMPHSMPPEDMLKSLAIQALARWTGLAHPLDMERVQATTQSSSLSSLVRDVIQKTREEVKPREAKEEVAVIGPGRP